MSRIFNAADGAIKADKASDRRYTGPRSFTPKSPAMPLSTQDANSQLDSRRRRAKFRAWHRGMKEMDLLLGQYADAHIATMGADDLDTFESLLEVLDRDLFKWFTGEGPVPAEQDTPLFRAICAHHGITRA